MKCPILISGEKKKKCAQMCAELFIQATKRKVSPLTRLCVMLIISFKYIPFVCARTQVLWQCVSNESKLFGL